MGTVSRVPLGGCHSPHRDRAVRGGSLYLQWQPSGPQPTQGPGGDGERSSLAKEAASQKATSTETLRIR